MEEINKVLQKHENNELSREEMLERSHSWQARENELRTHVSQLYEQARAKNCF